MDTSYSEKDKAGAQSEIHTGILQRGTLPPIEVQYEVINGLAVFEGDIILGYPEDLEGPGRERAVFRPGDEFRWRNGLIPYEIVTTNQARVLDAISHWEHNTSIRFVERTTEHAYVRFVDGDGCLSPIGRRGDAQDIVLGGGCGRGATIHEIGHSVGLWHEQSREDRDRFVTINWENIPADKVHNFNQHVTDGDDFGPYDYGSIMHYGAFAFANDPSIPTVIAPQRIGQREGLSAGDIAAVRRLYYFQRRGDSGSLAGAVSDIAAIRHRPPLNTSQQVLTAVRDGSGRLALITWRVNDDGTVARLNTALAGAASSIDIVRDVTLGGRYVTACRTGDGILKLISWNVDDDGAITRAGDSGAQAGEASRITVIAMDAGLFVTPVRTAAGTLKLISWRLNSDGSLTRLHDSGGAAGEVSEISSLRRTNTSPTGLPGQLVTSVRTAAGTLKLIVWSVAADGTIVRLGDSGNLAGDSTMIRSVLDNNGHIITSVKAGNGDLKLISWAISADGRFVSRLADTGRQAGEILENSLMRRGESLVSAVKTTAGNLKLIAWNVSSTGWLERAGDSYDLAGAASLIDLCDDALDGNAPIVTALRTEAGDLKLISWNDAA